MSEYNILQRGIIGASHGISSLEGLFNSARGKISKVLSGGEESLSLTNRQAAQARRVAEKTNKAYDAATGQAARVNAGGGGRRIVNNPDGSSGWEGQASNLPSIVAGQGVKTHKVAEAGSLGLAGVLKMGTSGQNFGKNMMIGAGVMGGGAALGSAFYGAASVALPNNAEVNNPLKNFTKAVGVGMAGGALFAASRGLGAEGLSRMVKPESASLFGKIQAGANFTKGALDNKLVIGAIGAATLAGSGDLNLTKPVNPVY